VTPMDAGAAKRGIEELVVEFAHRVDRGPTDIVADLFAVDGWYGWGPDKRTTGRESIRETYRARAALGPRVARHICTNVRLTQLGPERWAGQSIMLIFAENGTAPQPAAPLLVADVDDIYVLHEGVWLFESRQLTDLFADPTRTAVLPLKSR
jgi:hypothetical protein